MGDGEDVYLKVWEEVEVVDLRVYDVIFYYNFIGIIEERVLELWNGKIDFDLFFLFENYVKFE